MDNQSRFHGTQMGRQIDDEYSTTVPCKYCERVTRMTGTRMCNNCWELETRMLADPVSARKILDTITAEPSYDTFKKEVSK